MFMCCKDSGSLIYRPNEKLIQEIQGEVHTNSSFTAMLVQEQNRIMSTLYQSYFIH